MKNLDLNAFAFNAEEEIITRPSTQEGDGPIKCTWGYIIVKALGAIHQSEQPLPDDVSDHRYLLIKKCRKGGIVEVSIEDLAEMKKCLIKFFAGPSERGSAKAFLEG